MAGHSKWANTKYRKAAQDAKRGKIFTKIIRELIIATRIGGSDPISNPRLRAVIDKALYNNMSRYAINRAISRGEGNCDNLNTKTITYEGYAPGGAAVMVECLSDNRNRTVAEIRHAFSKYGGNLSTAGSVSYLFNKKGVISFERDDENKIIEAALEVGAEDFIVYEDGTIDVYTAWENMYLVYNALKSFNLKINNAGFSMMPSIKIDIDAEIAPKLLGLIETLEDCDDVQEIHHNGVIPYKIIESI